MSIAGFYFGISKAEWIFQTFAIGLVLSVEGLNTAVEKIADFIHPDYHEKIGFIKADIEGAEPQLLRGGRRVMDRSDNMRMAICTYHTQTDSTSIDALSKAAGFQTCFSHGFMVWGSENGIELRRGVLRAIKCTSPKLSPL